MVAEYLPAIGQAVGAVGGLFGGNYYKSEALRLQKRELKRNNRNNLWNMRFAKDQHDWNRRLNTHGKQMQAADAKAAWKRYGISPHLSMGAAPMQGGFVSPSLSSAGIPNVPEGNSESDAFRQLGNAISAIPNRTEIAAQRRAEAQGIRHRDLQNDLLQARIDNERATTVGILANATQRTRQSGLSSNGNPNISLVAEFGHYDRNGKWIFSHYGPNPEDFEIGATEIVAGTGIHGIGAGSAATIDGLVNHRNATESSTPRIVTHRNSGIVPKRHLPLQWPSKITHPTYTSRR